MLAQAKNQVLFHLEGVDLVSRLIDGQFPNYQQVLPRATPPAPRSTARSSSGRPAGGADRAAVGEHRQAPGRRRRGDAGVTVTATAEVGDYDGDVEAAVEGDGTTIAFNARYLADVLSNVDADRFALELNGPLSPGRLPPVGDDLYVHVVMPVRTTS